MLTPRKYFRRVSAQLFERFPRYAIRSLRFPPHLESRGKGMVGWPGKAFCGAINERVERFFVPNNHRILHGFAIVETLPLIRRVFL